MSSILASSPQSFDQSKKVVEYIIKNEPSQHPEITLKEGIRICQNWPQNLSGQNFHLIDEFFSASLVLGQFDWAQAFLLILDKQFPGTPKVMRM